MQIRLKAYDRISGVLRGYVPSYTQATAVIPFNDLPTLQLSYPRDAVNASLLEPLAINGSVAEIGLEVLWNGATDWIEPPNCRFTYINSDRNVLDQTPVRTYNFLGVGEALQGAYVFERPPLAPASVTLTTDGKVKFDGLTVGAIMDYLWTAAGNRGWGYLQREGWGAMTDTNGEVWGQGFTIQFNRTDSLKAVLDTFVRRGLMNYVLQGRILRLYKGSGTFLTPDYSGTKYNMLGNGGLAAGIDSGPHQEDVTKLATHICVMGDPGYGPWVFPTNITMAEGRREIFLQYNGITQQVDAQLMAQPYIEQAQAISKNMTRQFHLTNDTIGDLEPLNKFRPGAFVDIYNPSYYDSTVWNREKVQIQSVSITSNDKGIQGHYQLGDRLDTLLDKLYKKVQNFVQMQ